MKFIIIIVIVLVIIAAAQLMKVYELSSRLRNKDEADVTPAETKFNAGMLLLFYIALMISSTWLFFHYGARPGLGASASEYGVDIDFLYDVNWLIILIVFYITQSLLFLFAFKYQQKKGRKAVFFAHSTKLELLWTIIPAVVLAGIIIGGLSVWNKITTPKENATVIEIYAQQFGWTVRYAGEDNTLGNSDFKVIHETTNPLGVVTTKLINAKEKAWTREIDSLTVYLDENGDLTPDATVDEIEDKIERLGRQIRRLDPLRKSQTAETNAAATDDVIVKELHLVKGVDYEFKFRSRDVIHSALFPHFRAQMNCVPGMTTRFSFKPIITTAEMRAMPDVAKQYKEISENRVAKGREPVEFDYLLLCNKICGSSHYNMQIKIVVETQEEFDVWYAKQSESKTFEMLAGLGTTVANEESIDTNVAAIDTVNVITEPVAQ